MVVNRASNIDGLRIKRAPAFAWSPAGPLSCTNRDGSVLCHEVVPAPQPTSDDVAAQMQARARAGYGFDVEKNRSIALVAAHRGMSSLWQWMSHIRSY